jgi:hypothetical protein
VHRVWPFQQTSGVHGGRTCNERRGNDSDKEETEEGNTIATEESDDGDRQHQARDRCCRHRSTCHQHEPPPRDRGGGIPMLALPRRTIVRVGLWCPLLFLEAGRSFILTPIERASERSWRREAGGWWRREKHSFLFLFFQKSPPVSTQVGLILRPYS